MHPIPLKLRKQLAADPYYLHCIYNRPDAPNHSCRGRITWEHAFDYANKQVQEKWAIVPCCEAHNSGEAMVKSFNQFVAISRATINDFKKYPKKNWSQLADYLHKKYEL